METLANILQSNLIVGFILLVVVIPLYVKLGILDKFFGKNGNGKNKLQEYINEEQKNFNEAMTIHAQKANEEMGEVKEKLVAIETKIDIILKQNGK